MATAPCSPHQSRLSSDDELHWLALRMVPGLGARRANLLLDHLRTPQAIFRASRSELESCGLPGSVAQSVASGCAFDDAVIQQEQMRACGAELIVRGDPRYPASLGQIYDPPILMFARGRVSLLARPMLAVVGTRRPTQYGVNVTERLAADLSRAGLTIVSGMARGIDTAAHNAVLKVGGDTIAVFGCGVDVIYPADNRRLAGTLFEQGLVLSEFPMQTPSHPQNFPIRNRIVSGMSLGVLVVEGAQYSGSAITARLAMDQGREVFAVPGNITSKMSWGPNLLIKDGAKLVQDHTDVLNELAPELLRGPESEGDDDASNEADPQLGMFPRTPEIWTGAAKALLDLLRTDAPTHIDVIVESLLDFSPSELLAAIFELELSGAIRQLPGKNFAKVW